MVPDRGRSSRQRQLQPLARTREACPVWANLPKVLHGGMLGMKTQAEW